MPNLDVVRSMAVISVVTEHLLMASGVIDLGPFFVPYFGVLGVMVFFVLTSLVLMWSLERKPHTLDFYIRRFFRIYPLMWVALAATLILHAPVSPGTPQGFFHFQHMNLRGIFVQFTLLQGVWRSGTLIGVAWSITYEVLMYLFLPALFFYVQKNFSLWPLLVFWFAIFLCVRYTDPAGHNFGVAVDYFLPGVIAYVGFGRIKAKLPAWLLPIFLSGLWLAFWYRCNFQRGLWFCLIIGLALPLFRQLRSPWVLKPSYQIAKYSYGVYLMHPFALVIGLYLLRNAPVWEKVIGVMVPLVALPVIAYHVIEHPMIRLGSRLAAKAERRYEQFELYMFRQAPRTE